MSELNYLMFLLLIVIMDGMLMWHYAAAERKFQNLITRNNFLIMQIFLLS